MLGDYSKRPKKDHKNKKLQKTSNRVSFIIYSYNYKFIVLSNVKLFYIQTKNKVSSEESNDKDVSSADDKENNESDIDIEQREYPSEMVINIDLGDFLLY